MTTDAPSTSHRRRRAATGPVTLLVDEEGYLVKVYRVEPHREWVLEDLDHAFLSSLERSGSVGGRP